MLEKSTVGFPTTAIPLIAMSNINNFEISSDSLDIVPCRAYGVHLRVF
jgi:hypothetical protein